MEQTMLNASNEARPSGRVIYRKIVLRLIPFLVVCDILSVIDRLNIGFAKLQFMHDLSLNEAVVGMAAGVFYFGFTIFEIPSNFMLEKFGIRKTLLRIMGLWGLATMALAFVQNEYHLYILRFFLGAAEAGFLPGVMLYLTYWIPSRYSGRVTSLFLLAVPLAGVIAGPLSGWILVEMSGVSGFRGWQWLFLLEGFPSIVLGVTAYFLLVDRPQNAKWLSNDEKQIIARDLQGDRRDKVQTQSAFSQVLRNPQVYALAGVYFSFYTILNALSIWPPTLLKSVGVNDIGEIGLRSGAISLAAVVGMVAIGFSSDHYGERRWHAVGCGLVSGLAFVALPLGADSPNMTTLFFAIGSIGVYSFFSLFWTIPRTKLDGGAAAGGIALISSIGAIGGAFSPTFVGWMKVLSGSFYGALGALGVAFCLSMILLFYCVPGTATFSRMRKLTAPLNTGDGGS
jgi:MFS family permease